MKYDALIIGSGIGGLTSGSLLAKNGLKVLILEQHSKAGGYVTSYIRKGFLFDVVHVLGGIRKGSPINKIFSYLGIDKALEFIEVEKVFRFIYPDVTIDCFTDLNKYAQELIKHFPKERVNIERFFAVSKRIWDEILNCDYRPSPLQLLTYPFRFPNLVRYQDRTYQEFLDSFFNDRKLKEILGSGWGYIGLNNPRISALYMTGMYMSYHEGGAWYPRGGYQKLSDSLADCFKGFGGSLRLGTRVEKILVEGKKAVGVDLENGERIEAGIVISNSDTKKTFFNLVGSENLSEKFADKITHLEQSVSGFVVHLGVNMELPRELHCGCNMYFPDYGIAEDQFRLALSHKMETGIGKFGFGLSSSSLKDPGVAPAGCHTLDIIYMPAPYAFKNNWQKKNKKQYFELKGKIADTLIRAAESLIPDLSKHIITKEISTPVTYERYTSATQGGWYDAACTPGQSLLKRMESRTLIKNLYLTGAKSFPGPGMFGAIQSGLFTADILLDKKLTRGKYLLSVK